MDNLTIVTKERLHDYCKRSKQVNFLYTVEYSMEKPIYICSSITSPEFSFVPMHLFLHLLKFGAII